MILFRLRLHKAKYTFFYLIYQCNSLVATISLSTSTLLVLNTCSVTCEVTSIIYLLHAVFFPVNM